MKYILSMLLSLVLFSAGAATPPFMNKSPEEGLWEALEYYEIQHKEIVHAQAVLETGHFKSQGCRIGNNLFGIRKGKHYKTYSHWSESVKDYKLRIQSRYRTGEDYYSFLTRIRYATSPIYAQTLKRMVRGNHRK